MEKNEKKTHFKTNQQYKIEDYYENVWKSIESNCLHGLRVLSGQSRGKNLFAVSFIGSIKFDSFL